MLTLLKLESSKNPYLAIATSDPVRHLSVVVVGVDGRDNQWKSYAARIANNNAGTLLYDRPEQTWTGLMGAPIVDVNAEAVVGMHFGTTRPDSGTTPQGQGRSVAALELVELLKAGSVAATFR